MKPSGLKVILKKKKKKKGTHYIIQHSQKIIAFNKLKKKKNC